MTSIGSDRQSEQERETDAAFVERMESECKSAEVEWPIVSEAIKADGRRLISLARRAAAIPVAGAEDVTDAMVKAASWEFPCKEPASESDIRKALHAALAVMPRRNERAGMLRAAEHALELAEGRLNLLLWVEYPDSDHPIATQFVIRKVQEAREALRTATSEQPRDDGWQPIETAPKQGVLLGCVDGTVRMIDWGKTSHVPLHGWCVVDQGPEDRDLCDPIYWRPLPPAPVTK